MPTTNTEQAARLNFRLPSLIKERIESAALVSGVTVTDFAITALSKSADEALENHQRRVLSNRDRDVFLDLLENPREPNEALLNAVKEFKNRVVKK